MIALDTETSDPFLKIIGAGWCRGPHGDGRIAGISLAWGPREATQSTYLPIAHEGGDNMDALLVIKFLKEFLWSFKGTLVLMNGIYDLGWLSTHGIKVGPDVVLWDVMWAEALLDEHRRSYNLGAIASRRGIVGKNETLLEEAAFAYGVDKKGGLAVMPARFVGPYAEQDAVTTLLVFYDQQNEIVEQGLARVMKLEHDLVPMLLAMKKNGVRVDVKRAEFEMHRLNKEHDTIIAGLKSKYGLHIDVWSNDSIGKLFDQEQIPYGKTQKTGKPKIDDDTLKKISHEAAKLISRARKVSKTANTFCKNMVLDRANSDGRVQCQFHPLKSDNEDSEGSTSGTVSGRFSSTEPNLQQVPSSEKDPELGKLVRSLFLPEEGERWAACDYSQQEPRLTVHYAEMRGCSRGKEVADRYRNDPNTDYHSLVAELIYGSGYTKENRKTAKTINLGLAYGMGGAKLCRSLGYTTITREGYGGRTYEVAGPEGQSVLDRYFAEVPYVKELSDQYAEIASNEGAIRTLSGRLCRFPFYEPRNGSRVTPLLYEEACLKWGSRNIKRSKTHAALNRKIQGGSADMIKVALRELWRDGIVPLVTVHDENGVSVPDEATARRVGDIMRDCMKLRVPMKVDVELGNTWGEANEKLEDLKET